jgi:hypothetical protein
MSIANRSTNVRAKTIEHDQPNRGGACEDGWNAARPSVDGGKQESLLAKWRGLGNNLARRKIHSAWPRRLHVAAMQFPASAGPRIANMTMGGTTLAYRKAI